MSLSYSLNTIIKSDSHIQDVEILNNYLDKDSIARYREIEKEYMMNFMA